MRLMKILLAIIIMLSNFLFLPSGNTAGSFKLKKVGEHKLILSDVGEHNNPSHILGKIIVEHKSYINFRHSRIFVTYLTTGMRLWEMDLPMADVLWVFLDKDRLYLMNYLFHEFETYDNTIKEDETCYIYCFNAFNGNIIWRKEEKGFCSHDTTMKYDNTSLYATIGKQLLCIDKGNGKTKWSIGFENYVLTEMYNFDSGNRSFSYISSGYDENKADKWLDVYESNYGGYSHNIKRISTEGKKTWSFQSKNYGYPSITQSRHDSTGYLLWMDKGKESNNFDTTMLSLDSSSGEVTWKKKICIGCSAQDLWHSPFVGLRFFAIRDSYAIYKCKKNDDFVVLDRKTGNITRTIKTSSFVIQSKENDQIYIVNYKGIEAVKTLAGKRIWYKPLPMCEKKVSSEYNFENSVHEQDGKLFILTGQGLTCVDATNGKTLDSWNYKVIPKSVFYAGKNLVACEIVNTEGSPTVLLFEY